MEHHNLCSKERGVGEGGGGGKIAVEVTSPALKKAAAAIMTTSIRAQMARGKGARRDPWMEEPAEPGAVWTTIRARRRPSGGSAYISASACRADSHR